MNHTTRRCLLGVFAHPDDETSGCAGTLTKYARDGVEVHVVTATRGELGELGSGGLSIARHDLPAIRESELRAVLELYGTRAPIFLGYRDQELQHADFATLVRQVLDIMLHTTPEVIITFGPSGISRHSDHMAIHRATYEAFHRYRAVVNIEPRLYYLAIPEGLAREFKFDLDAAEMDISVGIDITAFKAVKIQGLRMYRSQQDAQELADLFAADRFHSEWFHQAYPAVARRSKPMAGFWEVE